LRCWGCFGALRGGNIKALAKIFDEKFGEERTKQLLSNFFSAQNEFKEVYANEATPKEETKKVKLKVSSK
jgi:glutamate synthase domain-containing protein 3